MERQSPAQMAEMMADLVNAYGSTKTNEFVHAMAGQHRTLQQSFTRLCVAWFEDLAKREHYDARNEASVMLAREFVAKVEERHLGMV